MTTAATIVRAGHVFHTLPDGKVSVYDDPRMHGLPADVIGHTEPDHPSQTGGLAETAAAWLRENARCACGPDHTGEDIIENPGCPRHGACADTRAQLAADPTEPAPY